MPKTKHQEEGDVLTKERIEVKEPPLYRVILLNDNYTTMEFVVFILQEVFRRSPEEANTIMLSVHKSGSGTAGIYTKEIAETKILLTTNLARQNQYPLRCVMEPNG